MKHKKMIPAIVLMTITLVFNLKPLQAQSPSRDNFNIIFENDFEDDQVGYYTNQDYIEDWNLPAGSMMDEPVPVQILVDNNAKYNKHMRGFYPEGTLLNYEHGFLWYSPLKTKCTEIYFSYDVFFKDGFEWVLGGKIPGVTGGKVTSTRLPLETDGFSARMMWKPEGAIVFYVYHQDQTINYGSTWYWGTYKISSGEWNNLTIRVVLNTITNGIAQNNGILEGFVNGKLLFQKTDIKFRSLETMMIDNMYISSFFGGNTEDWAATRDEYINTDNYFAYTYSNTASDVPRGNIASNKDKILLHPYHNFQDTIESTLPATPANFISNSHNNSTILLNWEDQSANEQGFRLERSTNSNSGFEQIATIAANTNAYTDTGLEPDRMYYYKICAFNATGSSSYAALQQATSPVLPSNAEKAGFTEIFANSSEANNRRALPVTMQESGTISSITIYHNGGTGNALVGIYNTSETLPDQRIAITNPTPVNTSAGWQTFKLATPVEVNKGSTIWLAWVFENGISLRYTSGEPGRAQSEETFAGGMPDVFGASTVNASIYSIYANYVANPTLVQIPETPTNLHLIQAEYTSATIGWSDNAQNESGFEIERINPADDTRKTFATESNVVNLSDEGLTENTTYQYRIRAFNDEGSSAWSDLLTVSTPKQETETPVVTEPVDPSNSLPVIANQQFIISEHSLNGNSLGTITAQDPDGDLLTYTIVSGNEQRLFILNSSTGELSLSNSSIFGPGSLVFPLTVSVTDNAAQPASASAIITIKLTGSSSIVYIDPENTGDPLANGSIDHPYDSWSNVAWKTGYTYLQKRGTTTTADKILIGANMVTLGAYGEGDLPIISSNTNTYLISGFEKAGIMVRELNLQAPNAVSSIYFLGNAGDSIIVEHCQLNANVNAIKVANGNTLVVRYNSISSNGEGVYSSATENQVYYNIFKNCQEAINIMGNSATAKIYNNVFYNNDKSLSVTYADLTLYNNIFYMNSPGQSAINHGTGNIQSNNNIYYPEQEGFITIASTVFDNLQQLQQAMKIDMNSFISDPAFVDLYDENFLLAENSPAINAGVDLNLGLDLLGSSVPLSGAADIGVYEFTGIIAPQEDPATHSLTLYPNPSTGKINIMAEFQQEDQNYVADQSEIRVIDLTGKTVFAKQVDALSGPTYYDQVDLTGIANGMYMVVMEIAGKMVKEKLLINR